MTDTRRRVKLYALNADRQWDDRGTGHVSSSYVDRLKGISLLVRAESDGSLLLESKIQPDTAYQKQQDTLIVWSEGDNFDLALSFQEKAGCDEIWEKICQVQGKDPSVEITQDIVEESEDERFDDMSDSAPPVELPSCELSRLEDINELISNCLTSPVRKEKLATAIENDGYIKKLLNLFHMCEDLENSEGLHHLYDIFKNIFLLNKNALFEVMFSEETIFDVIGCLEYEPTQSTPKRHREYLRQQAKFREAIPIRNPELLSKIHQTFRVQYIQDVVLPTPSVFEDNMLSTLSSFIFFNKIEIVTLVQEDEKFLVELFQMLTDENTPDTKRRDLVLFLKEFCNYSQNLQPQAKDTFYKTLTNLDILPALEITLASDDPKTKTASIDILTYIVEFSPSVVRSYTLQQASNTDEDHMLLNIIMEQMICDTDPELGGAVQLMGVLRMLLDPENMLAAVNKSEKSDFLNFFYKHSVHILIAPLLENTVHGEPVKEDYRTVQLLGLVLELLSFCVEHHTYHIKNCILNKDLLRRILVLMKSTHKFLVLCALRFMRKLIALKDEFYNRYIIKGNLFAPVVDAFVRNNGRYNLLDSAIIEMFEFIKLEDIKTLCSHVVENYGKRLDTIDYVQTFKALKLRYDHYQDLLKDRERNLDSVPSILRTSRYRRDQRQLDEEEEMWFNEDDDFDDNEAVVPATTNDLLTSAQTTVASNNKKIDSDLDTIGKIMDSGGGGGGGGGGGVVVGSSSSSSSSNVGVTSGGSIINKNSSPSTTNTTSLKTTSPLTTVNVTMQQQQQQPQQSLTSTSNVTAAQTTTQSNVANSATSITNNTLLETNGPMKITNNDSSPPPSIKQQNIVIASLTTNSNNIHSPNNNNNNSSNTNNDINNETSSISLPSVNVNQSNIITTTTTVAVSAASVAVAATTAGATATATDSSSGGTGDGTTTTTTSTSTSTTVTSSSNTVTASTNISITNTTPTTTVTTSTITTVVHLQHHEQQLQQHEQFQQQLSDKQQTSSTVFRKGLVDYEGDSDEDEEDDEDDDGEILSQSAKRPRLS